MKSFSLKNVLFCALLTWFSTTLFTTHVHATNSPGSNCNPATLGQALNLGFTTNQFGVSNPGTGPFFVVCPLIMEELVAHNRVSVTIDYSASTGGTNNCVIRFSGISLSSPVTAIPITVTSAVQGKAADTAIIPPLSTTTHSGVTLVCPLFPGETIVTYDIYPS